ncbi:MipA/OmpV family protein [Erythrobacter sp. WG]|uniref:MipA/OmpV family protein n=1 Tax=Erythrobacter sp. WG TaxID=2985510 RepID=UPI0022712E60|nr:MipA/OmpV family protein [Erythrobacter sp. WG]MCX9147295.1 MipA/OmpV family protein [Erythrobacter sp. WG]
MTFSSLARALGLAAALSTAPAFASEAPAETTATGTGAAAAESEGSPVTVAAEAAAQAQPSAPPSAPPAFALAKPVFDDNWATIGLGLGMVPSYAGSNDYIAFPLPLIVGRVGGVGISPNGPGFLIDLNPGKPGFAPQKGARIAVGPAFRLRNDRNVQIKDDVVARAGKLDAALEVGGHVGLAWRGVFKPVDQFSVGVQARWDVLGAHEGMVIEPQVSYRAPLGRAFTLQAQVSAEFVDDSFADYYFTVSPAQALASGLPRFRAGGGLNRIGTFAILGYDLDRNALNGGWSLTGVGGYSRLFGDAADTPYTALRGDPNQFILGLGIAYTF